MATNNSVNTYTTASGSNEVTMPSQPAFLAGLTADDDNVTGDGTIYQFTCDGEVFDQNADYNNGTGVFTAPVTGRYFLRMQVYLGDVAANHTFGYLWVETSNRNYINQRYRWKNIRDSGNDICREMTEFVDMDAADTADFSVSIDGGAKAIDLEGEAVAGTIRTSLSGFLAV